ncbi:hypothetical protein LZ554_001368 [Drepanopeziza brunnea f. sp. 'monogermtubi']|nr:hypothetical protein LZ554_001368 [Drepanopeziza brunnea f. sp. 'monogermtubi']
MDVAYNQHSRRHNSRSFTNLNHLTLAPLSSRLPLPDADALPDLSTSYIEGRSAPTTPSILSRSSSRVFLTRPLTMALPKSKSSTHLLAPPPRKQPRSGTTSPGGTRLRNELALTETYRGDSDWLLRAGAAISLSTRESKGQSWLVSRASSTSLTGQRDEDDEELERELAREREQASRGVSRRGSVTADADDELSPVTVRRNLSFGPGTPSRPHSRFASRGNSRRGSRAQLLTPIGGATDGYFDQGDFARQDFITEPDFVDAEDEEEDFYEGSDEAKKDDAEVRKLARANSQGLSGWVERMLGWSLFAVEEDGEDEELTDEKHEDSEFSSPTSRLPFDGIHDPITEEVPPPMKDGDVAGWQDAAWLLSVATKVLL